MSEYVWKPFSLADLYEEINKAEEAMPRIDFRFWKALQIEPVKWQLHPWGDEGGGFWAVGLIGRQVLWYNDIEQGFNSSRYVTVGVIEEYWCNQDDLNYTVNVLRHAIESGDGMGRFDPPMPSK